MNKKKRKQRTTGAPYGQTIWSLSSGKFSRFTVMDMYGRTSSSFVPSGKGTARLEIGHLPDEIEDLRRWFAGYYRPSVYL